ncbi:hypothetical protein Lsed01_01305 [Demequina sediminis]|uniref:Uncharacterized protein n=1 Tax=Demequina sediminis TaxID=1930058 RepID=A0ABP9WGC7_9MICO|nr:hypothetical protein [Demequina sediminis]BDZ61504.1 hypothetical protein GCM10025873_12950 [Demequina sediminis]
MITLTIVGLVSGIITTIQDGAVVGGHRGGWASWWAGIVVTSARMGPIVAEAAL